MVLCQKLLLNCALVRCFRLRDLGLGWCISCCTKLTSACTRASWLEAFHFTHIFLRSQQSRPTGTHSSSAFDKPSDCGTQFAHNGPQTPPYQVGGCKSGQLARMHVRQTVFAAPAPEVECVLARSGDPDCYICYCQSYTVHHAGSCVIKLDKGVLHKIVSTLLLFLNRTVTDAGNKEVARLRLKAK